MKVDKISFTHTNGTIDGLYLNAGAGSTLVIIVNGHNGFYTYGMFPYIQQSLYQHTISSYSFNFSHGGIKGDSDVFEDLKKYEANCMRLEVDDLLCALRHLDTGNFDLHTRVVVLAHSLGGVPTVFGIQQAAGENIKVHGAILMSTVKTLAFWPVEMIAEWTEKGVYYKKNNRTRQELPLGREFLSEVLTSEQHWNVKSAIESLQLPVLIVHGDKDEAIPPEHGQTLFKWAKAVNPQVELQIIHGATHTFNTKHPFEGPSAQLEEVIQTIVKWIHAL